MERSKALPSREASGFSFPRSARLLKSSEFQLDSPRRFQTPCFRVFYSEGSGAAACKTARLGVSVSKKVLRNAVQRNRVKRLLRESFRQSLSRLGTKRIVVIGLAPLKEVWRTLSIDEVRGVFRKMENAS